MDKINKYNQILYSIIGTILLIFLLIGGIIIIIDLFGKSTYSQNTLIVREELDSLKALNLRNQIVSLEGISLFDSSSNTYLIPVHHKQLSDPTSRDEKVLGVFDASSSSYKYYGYGNYNNLILYNFSTAQSNVLLSKRMNIDQYQIFRSQQRALVVFTGWDLDTNNDGKLGEEDFKQLYVYDHNSKSVKQVKNAKYRILDYQYLTHVDQLVFKVTESKDDAMNLEEQTEFLVSYSFEDNQIKPLIDAKTLNKLQDIIDN